MHNSTLIIISLLLSSFFALAQKTVNINFNNYSFDESTNELLVAVEIENTSQESFILGDQNIRFYYSSEGMAFNANKSYSVLNSEDYSEMEIVDQISQYNASLGTLKYDDNLGFVNYNIYLENLPYGGKTINKGQKLTLAYLSFDITNMNVVSYLNGARIELTSEYASAYISVTEWTQVNSFVSLEIENYGDTSFSIKKANKKEKYSRSIAEVGPNPTSDFIKLTNLSENEVVTVMSITGEVLYNQRANSNEVKIDVTAFQVGNYAVSIFNNITAKRLSQIVVITR